jgi:hypothetical protein
MPLQISTFVSGWMKIRRLRWANRNVPVFKHPYIAAAVEDWVSENRSALINKTVENICGWNDDQEAKIARWEALYISCRMAKFLSAELCQRIHDQVLNRSNLAVDFGNSLEAILRNLTSSRSWSAYASTAGVLLNHGARPDDQQAADRPFAAFRNGTEFLLAAGRFLQRRQSEPGREITAKSRPAGNPSAAGTSAVIAVEAIGPTPGIVINRRAVGSNFER